MNSRGCSKLSNQLKDHRLGAIASWVIVLILVIISLRGWVVINLNLPTEVVYGGSSVLLIGLALWGFKCRYIVKETHLTTLRNLLLFNTLFGFYYLIVTMLLGGILDVTFFYIYLLPYIIFLFLRISEDKINFGFLLIISGISFSVLDNFRISLEGSEGVLYLVDYYSKLRPLVFDALSRTGDYYRVGGYTASYHDSANILGILGSYYFVKSLVDKCLYQILIALVAFSAMAVTQSATNIVMYMLTCFIFSIYFFIQMPTIITVGLFFVIGIILTLIIIKLPEVLIFSERIGESGDWQGMGNSLTLDIIFSPSFWFGFGYTTGSEYVDTEIGYLKAILERGFVPACLLFWILIYPIYVFIKLKQKSLNSLPCLAAIVFGFLSLSHYGSLFRVTNVAIFYLIYSLFFIKIISDNDKALKKYET